MNQYDNLSDYYFKLFKKRIKFIKGTNSIILNFLKNKKIRSCLDIGSADGSRVKLFSCRLLDTNFSLLEPSKNLFKKIKIMSKDNLKKKNLKFENFKSKKKFDLILCTWNTLSHIKNLDKFFFTANKFLRKKKFLIFDINNRLNIREYSLIEVIKNLLFKRYIFTKKINGYELRSRFYDENEIINLFQKYNFTVKSKFYVDYKNGRKTTKYKGQILFLLQKKN
tara:strand:+ start:484 stop:1152 length:669 start_codon:yes stop_codon:yes gene_type:complete